MRYINIEDKEPPVDWQHRAEALTQRLMELRSPGERKEFINGNRIWSGRDFKEWLKGLFHNKCWYSEAKELFSFYDVDHFRPKSRAKQLDGTVREGYWWLAFDWRNYRICGSIGNRPHTGARDLVRGKADYFPLRDGTAAASGPSFDLNDEMNYLLDPTNPYDPLLLTFDETGSAVPAAIDNTWDFKRAKVTIDILDLNYVSLAEARKQLWNYCERLMRKLDNLTKEGDELISYTMEAEITEIMDKLIELIKQDAVLSSTAMACLLQSGRMWAKNLVANFGLR